MCIAKKISTTPGPPPPPAHPNPALAGPATTSVRWLRTSGCSAASWATSFASSKACLALASRYAELVTDARLRKRIFSTIEAEWHRTVEAMQAITGWFAAIVQVRWTTARGSPLFTP